MKSIKKQHPIMNLAQLLARLGEASDDDCQVTMGMMLKEVGSKSFGPVLVFAGTIAFSPLSGIPGVPTLMAIIVLLTVGQLLIGKRHVWLPRWILQRSISREQYEFVLKELHKPARFVDRFFRPRLTVLTGRVGVYVIGAVCAVIALSMPPMELVPFAATTAGAALTAFGLSLITHDGVMAIVALVITAGVGTLVVRSLV
jgi:hypothetical protein